MKLISKLTLLIAFQSAAAAVDTGVQQLRGSEVTFQQQLLGLKGETPPPRSHDLSPGWDKNPSERHGEGSAGRRSHSRKGRTSDTPRPQRSVDPSLTTTSSSLAPQYCTQPEGGCILRYNGKTWNKNGSECEGTCYCNYVNEKNRALNGGQPAFMCSKSPGDDVSLPDEDGVPDELSETATSATPTTTKASKEDRAAEREADRSSSAKSTKSPSTEREEGFDEIETATAATKASKEDRAAEREADRSSSAKSTKSPSTEREEGFDEIETATAATKASKEDRAAEKAARKAEREANRSSSAKSSKSPSAFDETVTAIA